MKTTILYDQSQNIEHNFHDIQRPFGLFLHIKRFVGHKVNGTVVTESGILAAAQLAGPGNVKRYLRSYGAIGFTDAFGTEIESYIRNFSSYDTSFIVPNRRPKAKLL